MKQIFYILLITSSIFIVGCGGGGGSSDNKELSESNLSDSTSEISDSEELGESNLSEETSEILDNEESSEADLSEDNNCNITGTFDYTYKHIQSKIGDKITIGDQKYTIVAIPFIEYQTGEHYYIKYPEESRKDIVHTIGLHTSYASSDSSCYTNSISNFPAMYDGTPEFAWYDVDFTPKSPKLSIKKAIISTDMKIKINKTVLHFTFFEVENIHTSPIENSSSMDARDSINWENVDINKKIFLDDRKRWLDYIEIAKITKDN